MKIAVIGAGAAGLFLTKMLAHQADTDICIFEKNSKPGFKIKASGGGKANILNTQISGECYNNSAFIADLLSRVNYETIRYEFEKMGLKMSIDEEKRVYPSTFFSQTILDILLSNLSSNVHFIYDYKVDKIQQRNGKYFLNSETRAFDKVVLAAGSPAGLIAKNRQHCYDFLTDFKLQTKDFKPSLVGFRILKFPKLLSGCRCKAICSLRQKGRLIHQEKGEVIFKDDGISGIVILNLSAYYNRLQDKKGCTIHLNLLHDDPNYDVEEHWKRFHSYTGLIHTKLCQLYERQPFNIKDYTLDIDGPYDFEFAQVCHGGISIDEINQNFELKKHKNVYAIGEILDIDGICGGYNLFFAWASAWVVAEGIYI